MGNGGDIDHHRVLQTPFNIADTRLDHTLLFTSGMVFGVFLEVAQLPRFTDRLAQARTLGLAQEEQFLFRARAPWTVIGYLVMLML